MVVRTAAALLGALLASASAQAQGYCGRQITLRVRTAVDVRLGGQWVRRGTDAPKALRLNVSPDCGHMIDGRGELVQFGREQRFSNTVSVVRKEPQGITIMYTTDKATSGNAAFVLRIALSPGLLARGSCTVDVNLASGRGPIIHRGERFNRDEVRIALVGQSCTATRLG